MIARLPKRDSLLFVYGTLRPCVRIPMARWLAAAGHLVGRARTRGRLYDLGAYPGLTAARRDDEWVIGDLYYVPNRRIFRALDRYEAGNGRGLPRFERVRRSVEIRRGRHSSAWLYVYRRPPHGYPRIAHGDYAFYLRHAHENTRNVHLWSLVASDTIFAS